MSKIETKYTCFNDCRQSGCPGHIAVSEYHGASDMYVFDDGKNLPYSKRYFDPTELKLFIDALHTINPIIVKI